MFANEPVVHVTVGPLVIPTLSVAVRVDDPVPPESTVRVSGLKVKTGGSVSLEMETVNVAVPVFPAASVAVAVHAKKVRKLTTGAV